MATTSQWRAAFFALVLLSISPVACATDQRAEFRDNSCRPHLPSSGLKLGPAIVISQDPQQSLAHRQEDAPWKSLLVFMHPGDTLHPFTSRVAAGYLILREGCIQQELLTETS